MSIKINDNTTDKNGFIAQCNAFNAQLKSLQATAANLKKFTETGFKTVTPAEIAQIIDVPAVQNTLNAVAAL